MAEGVDRNHDELRVENRSVKGLEFTAHDGRGLRGQALSYFVANRGADHMYVQMQGPEYSGQLDPETLDGKPAAVVQRENRGPFRGSGIVCAFSSGYIDEAQYEELFGVEYEDFLEMEARVVKLECHFNNERGLDGSDDFLPYDIPGLDNAVDEFYQLRGWNENGTVPDGASTTSSASGD